jgi:hypothetical protein
MFLEGVRKIGKTSQMVILNQEIGKQYTIKRFNFDSYFTPEELDNKINELRDWCIKNPSGKALVSGSVSYSVVKQDLKLDKYGSSTEEYEIPLKNFYNLLREFKVVNILMKSHDYKYLEKRYNEEENFNLVANQKIFEGFLFFENSNIAGNFKWETVQVSEFDSILKINNKIKKVIE